MPDTTQEILLGLELLAKVTALFSGQKSAAEVDAELRQGVTSNNDWLKAHGFPPVDDGA